MKFTTLDTGGMGHPAVLIDGERLLDLTLAADVIPVATLVPDSVRGIFAGGEDALELVKQTIGACEGLGAADRDRLTEAGAMPLMSEASLMAAIPNPNLILSEGLNYGKHLEEMSGTPRPPLPIRSPATSVTSRRSWLKVWSPRTSNAQRYR